ncbi:MAG: T9SS type A sorting domain-containing protein [Saprospiraceae bacterium]|nr:T9SS type A sorting domain-containing protein [Saprospiraceae bacterium]
MKTYKIYGALIGLLMVFMNKGWSQSENAFRNFRILINSTITDTVSSYFPPTYIPQNCTVTQPVSLGGGKYQLTISPNVGFTGIATVLLQYTEFKPPFSIQPRFQQYAIEVVPSIVKANYDYLTFSDNDPIIITPLSNDTGTDGTVMLTGIAQVQAGTAILSNDTIFYTPSENVNQDYIVYAVSDTTGATDQGIIYLTRQLALTQDTTLLVYAVSNRQTQNIILPAVGFSLTGQGPAKGILTQTAGHVFTYKPLQNSSGTDNFTLTNPENKVVAVQIKIVPITVNTSSVVDDVIYTAVNTPVSFNVLINDLSNNFPISAFSPGLQHNGNGNFTYNPPSGFTGQKNFSYTVNYGTYTATGKITINIGNFAPQYSSYQFSVLKNQELVLEYDVPVAGYQFELLSAPQFGEVEIFNQSGSIQSGCNTLQSKAVIIYTPYSNYFGSDELDIRYCINGAQCKIYKIYLQVLNQVAADSCVCSGNDCVWAGDTNGDGRVSVTDLLPLGRYMGASGPGRSPSGLTSNGDFASNWPAKQVNGKNLKFADADGDGLISADDLNAVKDHYGAVRQLVPSEVLGIKDYPFNIIPSSTEVDSGDLLTLYVQIGSNNTPVRDIYGLAFGLNLNPMFYDSSSLEGYFYENSWFANPSPTLQLIKQPVHGAIHAGFTRTGNTPGSGNGIIGQFSIVVDEADGFKTDEDFIEFRIETDGIIIEDISGEQFMLEDSYVDIRYRLKKSEPVPTEDKLLVYPNPAQQNLSLHFNGRNIIHSVTMTDVLGNNIFSEQVISDNHADLNVGHLYSGIYILKVRTSEGIITKKVQIIQK